MKSNFFAHLIALNIETNRRPNNLLFCSAPKNLHGSQISLAENNLSASSQNAHTPTRPRIFSCSLRTERAHARSHTHAHTRSLWLNNLGETGFIRLIFPPSERGGKARDRERARECTVHIMVQKVIEHGFMHRAPTNGLFYRPRSDASVHAASDALDSGNALFMRFSECSVHNDGKKLLARFMLSQVSCHNDKKSYWHNIC
jgi:hypothetical protein